jgi:hypothetical protein
LETWRGILDKRTVQSFTYQQQLSVRLKTRSHIALKYTGKYFFIPLPLKRTATLSLTGVLLMKNNREKQREVEKGEKLLYGYK